MMWEFLVVGGAYGKWMIWSRASKVTSRSELRCLASSFTSEWVQPSRTSCMMSGTSPYVTWKNLDMFQIESRLIPYVVALCFCIEPHNGAQWWEWVSLVWGWKSLATNWNNCKHDICIVYMCAKSHSVYYSPLFAFLRNIHALPTFAKCPRWCLIASKVVWSKIVSYHQRQIPFQCMSLFIFEDVNAILYLRCTKDWHAVAGASCYELHLIV